MLQIFWPLANCPERVISWIQVLDTSILPGNSPIEKTEYSHAQKPSYENASAIKLTRKVLYRAIRDNGKMGKSQIKPSHHSPIYTEQIFIFINIAGVNFQPRKSPENIPKTILRIVNARVRALPFAHLTQACILLGYQQLLGYTKGYEAPGPRKRSANARAPISLPRYTFTM